MPDWSYHLLFKPILKRLPAYHSREFIHRGMNNIASIPGGRHLINFLGREESDPLLEKRVESLRFPNSIGLSGKIDPLLSGSKAFSNLGFGFLEIGPVMLSNSKGVPPKVNHDLQIVEFADQNETISLEEAKSKLNKITFKQPIFIRLAGNFEEQLEIISSLDEYADAFILDTASYSHARLDFSFHLIDIKKPLFISVKADQLQDNLIEYVEKHLAGIVLDECPNRNNNDNLSLLLEGVRHLRKHHFSKTIITVGGIIEPNDALQLFDSQVDLIMLSGGYVFSGPGLPKRIKEAQLHTVKEEKEEHAWIWYFLFGLSIFIGGLIAFFFSMTTVILSYDEYFLGMTREEILTFNERIIHFMAHDRMTLAGTMISGGIIYMFLARCGIRKGLLWAKQATDIAAIIGFLGIFLFIGYGYFDWLHLIFWLILAPFFIIGYLKTRDIKGAPSSTNRRNHKVWKKSLLGQLLFVILGCSFILGGFIISYIGITHVFVNTDLAYICMPPEMLHQFNDRLIPVIAHDRAGFGSALISVGLLVLTVSLWGFQQGNKWVWWLLFIGGIPAFAAGIGVHFAIGYTSFIHLLPAYYAFALHVIGLILTYHFFHKKND